MTKQEKEAVVKRLKEAADADPKGKKAGREFGRQWAKETANPRLLRRVAAMVNLPAPVDEDAPEGCSALCTHLVYVISEADDFDKALGAAGAFLIDSEDFALGFIKGALDVWGEVESEM